MLSFHGYWLTRLKQEGGTLLSVTQCEPCLVSWAAMLTGPSSSAPTAVKTQKEKKCCRVRTYALLRGDGPGEETWEPLHASPAWATTLNMPSMVTGGRQGCGGTQRDGEVQLSPSVSWGRAGPPNLAVNTGMDTKPCCGPGANRLVSSRTTVVNLVTAEIQVLRQILTSLAVKSDHEVVTGSDKDLEGKETGYHAYPFRGSYSTK